MELVGRVGDYHRSKENCYFYFHCTNKEDFTIYVAPVVPNLPENERLRIWTLRPDDKDGMPQSKNVLIKWERLDSDKGARVLGKDKKQNVLTWVKEEIDE